MDHIEVTTRLDLVTTRRVVTRTLEDRGFRVDWEEDWSARASKLFRSIDLTVFAPRARLTVVQLRGNATGWYYVLGLWGGLWSDRYTDRIADAVTDALTEREAISR